MCYFVPKAQQFFELLEYFRWREPKKQKYPIEMAKKLFE